MNTFKLFCFLYAHFRFMASFTQENNYMLNGLAAQSRQEQQPGPG
jgi:prolipoprotein diacylglyceryltransferase